MALPSHVTIRQAGPEDAEALGLLHLDVWDDAYVGLMPQSVLDQRRADAAGRIERWREILTSSDEPTHVAETASEGLVGFAGSGPARDNDVDLKQSKLTHGPLLRLQADREAFGKHPQADALLSREYRKPFVVPSERNL